MADLKMTDQIVRKMAEMKLADLKMADQKNDRCVRRSTGRRLTPIIVELSIDRRSRT